MAGQYGAEIEATQCMDSSDLKSSAILFKHAGKVRDVYILKDKIVLVSTDRQSAFDRAIATIPCKGQVLTETSVWWFNETQHIIPNHLISNPAPAAIVCEKCTVFPIEFVVRGYITGSTNTSMWTHYANGVRNYCGNLLADGWKKHQKLPKIMVTPTTKDAVHDELISPEAIVAQQLMTQEDWDYCAQKSIELFEFGQQVSASRGLILVDTKYEFGRDAQGVIRLIDEIHTPDSSRYWIGATYEERMNEGQAPDHIDKEFLRLWFKEHSDPYKDQVLPIAPKELLVEVARRYISLYEMITEKKFVFHSGHPHERLQAKCESLFGN